MNFLWELCVTYIHFKLFAKRTHVGKILLLPKMFWQEKKKNCIVNLIVLIVVLLALSIF